MKRVNFHPPLSEPPSLFFFLSLKYWLVLINYYKNSPPISKSWIRACWRPSEKNNNDNMRVQVHTIFPSLFGKIFYEGRARCNASYWNEWMNEWMNGWLLHGYVQLRIMQPCTQSFNGQAQLNSCVCNSILRLCFVRRERPHQRNWMKHYELCHQVDLLESNLRCLQVLSAVREVCIQHGKAELRLL